MRILLITSEEWNDIVYGNNVLTNWFDGFDAEFAQIYCSPGLPYNNVCNRYFQITDAQMALSLIPWKKRSGAKVQKPLTTDSIKRSHQNAQRQGIYKWFKEISLYLHTPILMLRDAIWMWGRYDKKALSDFVSDFRPDIVYCPRFFSPKLMRLERLVSTMTDAPFVAFTADNEASLNHYNWSPLFWGRAWLIHKMFCKHVKLYKHYFMFSEEQAQDYNRLYGIPTSTLYKCGHFADKIVEKKVHSPIRMVYAGRLYCNRWKTLCELGKALDVVNKNECKIFLDIYTTEELTRTQKTSFNEIHSVYIHPAITPQQLVTEYHNADIALHVESFDKSNRAATRYSFSTKIIDLMASSCAIMAICWEKHAGYQYLKEHDAAFCISSYNDILPVLEKICAQPALIGEYAKKAWECGGNNHSHDVIHKQIRDVFNEIIEMNMKGCTNK